MEKFSNATFFRQIALQNLQRKNLGFSETDIDELIIDEEDQSVWQLSSKGQATAPPSGEELPELLIT